jgi:serine/threonine protein kinase
MVHRSISPENIYIDHENKIRIIHYGLIKSLNGNDPNEVFNVNFNAPEIFGFLISQGCDLWSVGIVFDYY